jgi:hypothetical protein
MNDSDYKAAGLPHTLSAPVDFADEVAPQRKMVCYWPKADYRPSK